VKSYQLLPYNGLGAFKVYNKFDRQCLPAVPRFCICSTDLSLLTSTAHIQSIKSAAHTAEFDIALTEGGRICPIS
jgi:hypothetical protein